MPKIIDRRGQSQKRVITITIEKIGHDYNIDRFVDSLIKDIGIVMNQRDLPDKTTIDAVVE